MGIEIEDLPKDHTIAAECTEQNRYSAFGFIRVKPSNCILPGKFKEKMNEIMEFKTRPDDVFVVSLQKCGTTWAKEMIWMMVNNYDFEGAKVDNLIRVPHLDLVATVSDELVELFTNPITNLEKMTTQRVIQSHLPVELLPTEIWTKQRKVVFITRDPRDAAISNYHHHKAFNSYQGTLEKFLEYYIEGKVVYTPYWEIVLHFWRKRNEPNMLFITYEQMKTDLESVIKKTAKFLDKEITPEQVEILKDHLSFNKMKANTAVNFEPAKKIIAAVCETDAAKPNLNFMREGKSGGWKNVMSKEMADRYRKWIQENVKGTGMEELYWD